MYAEWPDVEAAAAAHCTVLCTQEFSKTGKVGQAACCTEGWGLAELLALVCEGCNVAGAEGL